MSDNVNPEEPAKAETSKPLNASAEVRRRLLRGGLIGAPIILSVASRSVLACASTTPSAFGSISASRPDVLVSLSGQPPSYWCQNQGTWPSPYFATTKSGVGGHTATLFKNVLKPSPFSSSCTLLDALYLRNGCSDVVAQYMVAALLNGAAGKTSAVLGAQAVINMWYEYASKGYFEPTAGIKWYARTSSNNSANGIVGYLSTTWT